MSEKHPEPQSVESRELNQLHRKVVQGEQWVWAVYNSGDPLWKDDPYVIELLLFATKRAALQFVRAILHRHFDLDVEGLSDDEVEPLMFDGDTDRYLHLYELRVHPDDYLTVTLPF